MHCSTYLHIYTPFYSFFHTSLHTSLHSSLCTLLYRLICTFFLHTSFSFSDSMMFLSAFCYKACLFGRCFKQRLTVFSIWRQKNLHLMLKRSWLSYGKHVITLRLDLGLNLRLDLRLNLRKEYTLDHRWC